MRLQSAMEYLMTYGWAILIIAVVLGVLYYLGIFNSANLAPRLQPGSCHVARTAAGVQNFGVCAGLPEFVAKLNGVNSYVSVNTAASLNLKSAFTFGAWALPVYKSSTNFEISERSGFDAVGLIASYSSSYFNFGGSLYNNANSYFFESAERPYGQWYYVTYSYNSTSGGELYVNGQSVYHQSTTGNNNLFTTLLIGESSLSPTFFNGSLSNVQIYNASLSAAEVKALYMEGIGGAPIVPQNIVGWWPLNGDANDYSGNNNNGQSNNVQYTNTWINSYSAP